MRSAIHRWIYRADTPNLPRQKKDPVHIAEEELRSLLKWAIQTRHDNAADALRRVLAVLAPARKRPRRFSHSTK
jgi:hypothetical protein